MFNVVHGGHEEMPLRGAGLLVSFSSICQVSGRGSAGGLLYSVASLSGLCSPHATVT